MPGYYLLTSILITNILLIQTYYSQGKQGISLFEQSTLFFYPSLQEINMNILNLVQNLQLPPVGNHK